MDNSEIQFGLFEKSKTENVPTHIESVDYDLVFNNLLVDTKLTQKFTNLSKEPVELEYKYRNSFSPHFLEVTLLDPDSGKKETLRAKIHTKEEGFEKYDDALARGNRGVLLEKSNDQKMVSLSLGNIKPKMQITIMTKYVSTALLETDEDDPDRINFLLSLPALTNEMRWSSELEKTMQIRVVAEGAKEVISLSHDNALTKIGPGLWRTSKKSVSVTEEFELQVTYQKYPFSTLSCTPINYKNFKYAGILSLFPNFAAQRAGGYELIIIIDCSGSMSGSRMKCAVEALKLFMQSLDADRPIKYNIIRFGSTFKKLFPRSVKFDDDKNFELAKHFVNTTVADLGGTNMLLPIKSVFGKERGKINLEGEIPKYVSQRVCTFKLTEKEYTQQKWYYCPQCFGSNRRGCCESCARVCHKGHYGLREADRSPSRFFCDCGSESSDCKGMMKDYVEGHQKGIPKYVQQNVCTFKLTQKEFTYQRWFNCLQCFGEKKGTGCCESCAKTCHSGHVGLKESPRSPGRFFCDCGNERSGCKGMMGEFAEQHAHSEEIEYTQQLFLFTDGEDEYPRQIEALIAQKHKELGVRVFSFGIGRGINQTFLRNCARWSQGSAVFIQDIKEEMKSQVLRQLSNAFRASIDNIQIKNGITDTMNGVERAKVKGSLDNIPLIFNGRSHHEYYFLEKLPEKVDVEFQFLGVKMNEEVKIMKMDKESHKAIGIRVANEFVKSKKEKKEVTNLGLYFNLATKHTSFFLESEADEKVVSEMKVVSVIPTEVKVSKVQYLGSSQSCSDSDSDDDLMDSGIEGSDFSEGGCMEEFEEEEEDDECDFECDSGGEKSWLKEESSPMVSMREELYYSAKQESSNDRGGENVLRLLEREMEREKKKVKEEEEEEEKKNKVHDVKGAVSVQNLNQLLLLSNIRGIWTMNMKTLKLIGFYSKDQFVKVTKPDRKYEESKENLSLWLSAIILAVLNRFYRAKKSEWNLISKKSTKFMTSKFNKIIAEAKRVVSGW